MCAFTNIAGDLPTILPEYTKNPSKKYFAAQHLAKLYEPKCLIYHQKPHHIFQNLQQQKEHSVMLKNLMSLAGFSDIELQTELDDIAHTYLPSQTITGSVHIKVGQNPIDVNHLTLHLSCPVKKDDIPVRTTLYSWNIDHNFHLPANKTAIIPFEIPLPADIPVTENFDVSGYPSAAVLSLKTELDIPRYIDKKHETFIIIAPTPVMEKTFAALESLGFYLFKVDVESGYLQTPYYQSPVAFFQEFEFKLHGVFNRINEIEISFLIDPHNQVTYVILEIDKIGRSDTYRFFSVSNHNANQEYILQQIQQLLM